MNIREYSGNNLRRAAFPLGGIGTGSVSLGGRGNLMDWEIFNRPGKGTVLPYTMFTLRVAPAHDAPVMRMLEGGLMRHWLWGILLCAVVIACDVPTPPAGQVDPGTEGIHSSHAVYAVPQLRSQGIMALNMA